MTVLRHVIDSISPASQAHAEGARQRVASAAAPLLERLAAQLGGAQHTPRIRAARRTVVVVAGDHGVADPGIALGPAHPTVLAAHAIADGSAALAHVARASGAPIVLVDAGVTETVAMPASAIQLGRGPTRDATVEPAMSIVDAALALEQGIALSVSLSEGGLDLIALGAIGVGADVGAAALLAASGGDVDDSALAALGRGLAGAGPLEQLAALGGPETAVLAGLILGAASINVPLVLDGEATGAAALAAVAFAPAVRGYLIAAHAGTRLHRRILARLGLSPIFDVGLGHGEGTGAAMVIPLVDQVAALTGRG